MEKIIDYEHLVPSRCSISNVDEGILLLPNDLD